MEGVTRIAPCIARAVLLFPRDRQEGQQFCKEIPSLPIISRAIGQLGGPKVDTVNLKIKPKGKDTGGKKLVCSTAQRRMCVEHQVVPSLSPLGTRASRGQTLTQRYRSLLEVF